MELSTCVVDFEKRSAIKSHIIANSIAEWTEPRSLTEGIIPKLLWLVYCDGVWGSARVGAAEILISPSEIKLRYTLRLQFFNDTDKCANNMAKYEAILLGLRKLRAIGVQTCIMRTDSKVVASQIEKECIAREPTLKSYLALVRTMENHFKGFTVEYIETSKNNKADELAKAVACNTSMPTDEFFQVVPDASIKTVESEPKKINIIEGEDWRAPIMGYPAIIMSQIAPWNTLECSREIKHIK
jgi:ribonuclease HI